MDTRQQPADTPDDNPVRPTVPLTARPAVRVGVYAWAFIGVIVLLVVAGIILSHVTLIVVPLVLALFPTALLAPPTAWLIGRGVPRALAALMAIVGALLLAAGVITVLIPAVAAELPVMVESAAEGFGRLQAFLGTFGITEETIDDVQDRAVEFVQSEQFARGVFGAAVAVVQAVAGLLFGVVTLFFYLKDGARIAAWIRDLFPERARRDVQEMGVRAWRTIGAYFRGQLLVALVDAVFIGLGLVILRVPLALPLAVIVFFGGLFPIVGAFVSGALAVLVALATRDIIVALLVLAVVVAVQQLESNILAPVVLGKATALHPLAVIVSLAIGGVLLGVLGAFLAVPVAASLAHAIGYLRARIPG